MCLGTLKGMVASSVVQCSSGKLLHSWSLVSNCHWSMIQRETSVVCCRLVQGDTKCTNRLAHRRDFDTTSRQRLTNLICTWLPGLD